jgi:hypothetical protein
MRDCLAAGILLPHGYTMMDLHKMTLGAIKEARWRLTPFDERYGTTPARLAGNLPERRRVAGAIGSVQPGEQPGVVEFLEPVEAVGVGVGDIDRPVLGPVDRGLDRRGLPLGMTRADDPDHRQRDKLHAAMLPRPAPRGARVRRGHSLDHLDVYFAPVLSGLIRRDYSRQGNGSR